MTFEYIGVDEAMARDGLRMVVLGGVPSPWGEAAKGFFHIKRIPWVATRLVYDSEALKTWGGCTAVERADRRARRRTASSRVGRDPDARREARARAGSAAGGCGGAIACSRAVGEVLRAERPRVDAPSAECTRGAAEDRRLQRANRGLSRPEVRVHARDRGDRRRPDARVVRRDRFDAARSARGRKGLLPRRSERGSMSTAPRSWRYSSRCRTRCAR